MTRPSDEAWAAFFLGVVLGMFLMAMGVYAAIACGWIHA